MVNRDRIASTTLLSFLIVGLIIGAVTWAPASRLWADPFDDDSREARAEAVLELIEETVREYDRTAGVFQTIDLRRASARERRIARALKGKRLSLKLVDQTVGSTLDLVRDLTGLSVVVSGKARKALAVDAPKVSMVLRDVPLENVLNLLAMQLGEYRFTVRYGVLQLVTRDEFRVRLKLRVYNIQDILYRPPDFPAPHVGLDFLDQHDE